MTESVSDAALHALANRLDELEQKSLRMQLKLDQALSQQHKLFSELYSRVEELEELIKEGED